jgi:hypothetical protein
MSVDPLPARRAAAIAASACLALTFLVCSKASIPPSSNPTPTPVSTPESTPSPDAPTSTVRVQPADIVYRGAFRLPGGEDRPDTFAYGGNAMTYSPAGDLSGGVDGHPGSLFVMGHDRLPWGELPNGGRVAEVSIPAPVITTDVSALPQATFLQGFHDVVGSLFDGLDEIPRADIEYLDHPATGPRIHVAWGQHFQEEQRPSHGFFSTNLDSPSPQGAWHIADTSLYSINGYLFEIPAAWADAHAQGRRLATGRYRDGGWSGKGPALYAYLPWADAAGTLPPPGASLQATRLLLYESSQENEQPHHQALDQYQHADEWEGGAWITTASGKSAVAFVGTKGTGAKFWYGWVNPAGAEIPCIETDFRYQYTTCWSSDGTPCPDADLNGCEGHTSYRGWWSSSFSAQILLFDPEHLARVAAGTAEPSSPQPYATADFDAHLFHNPSGIELEALATGVQRRYRIGATAFDRSRGYLYVLELYADGAKPVVHVFSVTP